MRNGALYHIETLSRLAIFTVFCLSLQACTFAKPLEIQLSTGSTLVIPPNFVDTQYLGDPQYCGSNYGRLGEFTCDEKNNMNQTICGCRPPLYDNPSYWIDLGLIDGKECYSHYTGTSCNNPQIVPKSLNACGANWPTLGSFTCDSSGSVRQTICECTPPQAGNASLWYNAGGGCYSHATGNSCSPANSTIQGIWDPVQNLGTWRTDLDDPSKGTVSNPITLLPCTFANGFSGQCDQLTNPDFTRYPASNASTSENFWPTNNFWVVHANNEGAYGPDYGCSDGGANNGPPGQSRPVSRPGQGVLGFEFTNSNIPKRKKAMLGIDQARYPNCVSPIDKGKIPFISFGLQSNRGAGPAPITYLNNGAYSDVLKFTATIEDIAPDAIDSSLGRWRTNLSYVFAEASWNGKRRWLYITLMARNPNSAPVPYQIANWNWNVAESMWANGAEIVYIDANELKRLCPSAAVASTMLQPRIGSSADYILRLSEAFRCVSNSGRQSWSNPFPNTSIALTGVHWGIELTFGRNWQKMSVQNIDLTH